MSHEATEQPKMSKALSTPLSSDLELVFFHVGDDIELPKMLVTSIKSTNPLATITQLTDVTSPAVPGVHTIHRHPIKRDALMMARAGAYAQLKPTGTLRLFIDTDMLVVNELFTSDFNERSEIYLCRRHFDRHSLVNINFRGMNMREYADKTLDEAWPFLGCFIATRTDKWLAKAYQTMIGFEEKYQSWYGDQTALRMLAEEGMEITGTVSEREYAHLFDGNTSETLRLIKDNQIKIIHFKGNRKQYMPELASLLFNWKNAC
jgi:hypothetical protein